ncbi:MAG TPA: rubredoxin [Gammaproteobacteria bacterium]|nr:rubredoxin [Gammaproteobacteria bacterium]
MRYLCLICGYIYDEEQGDPDSGIPANTLWADVSEEWMCPECAAMKDDFEMIAI